MPIYEYRCTDCQQVFEEWCKQVEETNTQHSCPICGGQADRLISQTSFALKGQGWYVTEYGSRKGTTDTGSTETSSVTPVTPASDAAAPIAAGTPSTPTPAAS